MTIVAKFPSRCACCGGSIQPGDKIEWSKGQPARHARCAAKPARAAAPKREPVAKVDVTGCKLLRRESQGRHDNYEVGQVIHALRIEGGGGDDGRYWTVVRVEPKYRDYGDDDQWMVACWARPSTPEECQPLVAGRQAAEQRKALVRELENLCQAGVCTSDDAARCPAGQELVIDPGVHGSGKRIAVLAEDGSVSIWCSGYYDDYRQTLAVSREPRAAEIFTQLGGSR